MGKLIACLMMVLMSMSVWSYRHYQAPLGDEKWRANGNRLRCGLSLNVPEFGTAYFEQYAAKEPHFIMTKWQQVPRRLATTIRARSPQWKPDQRRKFITTTAIKPGKYGIFLRRDKSLKVLNTLRAGYKTQFNYRSDLGDEVFVDLSPVHFQPAFNKYMKCVGNLLPFDFDMVRHTTLYYGSNDTLLNDEAMRQLDRIRLYVLVDKRVRKVAIVGYTDSGGRNGYNNAISQLRAEGAKNYLLRRGVPERLINITWYGQKRPAASNKTAQGQALNRRVVIDIYK